jgi:hypothetical protein
MTALPEFSLARTTRPITITDDEGDRHDLPAGTICTIADVLQGGKAYIAEFQLEPPVYAPDGTMIEYPLEEITTLEPADLEPLN